MKLENSEKVQQLLSELKTLRRCVHFLSAGCDLQIFNPNLNAKYDVKNVDIKEKTKSAINERIDIINQTLETL